MRLEIWLGLAQAVLSLRQTCLERHNAETWHAHSHLSLAAGTRTSAAAYDMEWELYSLTRRQFGTGGRLGFYCILNTLTS